MSLGGQRLQQTEQMEEELTGYWGQAKTMTRCLPFLKAEAFLKAEGLSWSSQQHLAAYLLHCAFSELVAALFSSSVVFCSCTEAPAAAWPSESSPSFMITISISRSKHGDR